MLIPVRKVIINVNIVIGTNPPKITLINNTISSNVTSAISLTIPKFTLKCSAVSTKNLSKGAMITFDFANKNKPKFRIKNVIININRF